MTEKTNPNQIEKIIEALDINIKNLEEANRMTMMDVKTFILDILGTMRDMWERLKDFFLEMQKIKEIEECTEKGEKYKQEISEEKKSDLEGIYL